MRCSLPTRSATKLCLDSLDLREMTMQRSGDLSFGARKSNRCPVNVAHHLGFVACSGFSAIPEMHVVKGVILCIKIGQLDALMIPFKGF